MVTGQTNQNALSVGLVKKCIRTVLDELEELPMGVSTVCCIVLLIRVFGDKPWLRTIGFEGFSASLSL